MANATLIVLSSVSGVPLLSRVRGTPKQVPYHVVGSLNGVYMFADSQGTKLLDARTSNTAITWKTFHDSIRLILIHECGTKIVPQRKHGGIVRGSCSSLQLTSQVGGETDLQLLNLAFDAMVMLLSLDALKFVNNVEKLKKNMKICYPVLDLLLDQFLSCSGGLFSCLIGCADTVLPPDNYNLQTEVTRWSESQCNSSYGCLLSSTGRVLAATKQYWTLSSSELVLLPILLATAPISSSAKDIPVYLPQKSPKVPLRLLGVRLTARVWAVTVCGTSPSLATALRSAVSFWGPYYAGLETLSATYPYNMTAASRQTIDKAVLGLLFVSHESKRCMSCVHLGTPENEMVTAAQSSVTDKFSSNYNDPGSIEEVSVRHVGKDAFISRKTEISLERSISSDCNSINADSNSHYISEKSNDLRRKSVKTSKPLTSHQTGTLKSTKTSKGTTIHTYHTVEANISPVSVKKRPVTPNAKSPASRALSPVDKMRAFSPSRAASALSNKSSTSKTMESSNRQTINPTEKKNVDSTSCSNTNTMKSCRSTSSAVSKKSNIQNAPRVLTPSIKTSILAHVYRNLTKTFFWSEQKSDSFQGNVTEAYLWCGGCRVYALKSAAAHLLVILPAALPHALARLCWKSVLSICRECDNTACCLSTSGQCHRL